jgi:cytochrome P450
MLCDRPLIEAVRNETDTHIASDGTCDIDSLVTSCPNLDAVWNETLRLYIASTAVRKASANCIIGGKIIHKDDQIFGPARNWQLDAQYFGENAHHFDAGRWIRNKALSRSKGFTPFGGGQTYCPGRYFAQRETYSFIASLLQRYDLQVTHRDGCIIENASAPPVEVNLPAPAAMRPVHDVYVTLRERNMDM